MLSKNNFLHLRQQFEKFYGVEFLQVAYYYYYYYYY